MHTYLQFKEEIGWDFCWIPLVRKPGKNKILKSSTWNNGGRLMSGVGEVKSMRVVMKRLDDGCLTRYNMEKIKCRLPSLNPEYRHNRKLFYLAGRR